MRGQVVKYFAASCGIIAVVIVLALWESSTGGKLTDSQNSVKKRYKSQKCDQLETTYDEAHNLDQNIIVRDFYPYAAKITGAVFHDDGHIDITGDLLTTLVHQFYPQTEDHVRKMFPNPSGNDSNMEFYIMSPGMTFYKGEIIFSLRLWFNYEKRYSENTISSEPNSWFDNYLLTQKFDRYFKPKTNLSIIGIPAPRQYIMNGGPSDGRLVKVGSHLWLSFYMCMKIAGKETGHLYLWEYNQNYVMKPTIKNYTMTTIDSNWSPLDIEGTLYYIYTLDPLRVLKCDSKLSCAFTFKTENADQYPFKLEDDVLRGGSPFDLYKWPYYLCMGHARVLKKSNGHSVYTANLVLLSVLPVPRIVFVSSPIHVQPTILDVPIIRGSFIDDPYIYPLSLIIEDLDTLMVGVTINDNRAAVIRVRNVKNILQEAMDTDKRLGARKGPKIRTVQKYIKSITPQN
ncbi:uncharacterized protein LOC106151431 [Lingula anatina]|uniref:Uncharacterized protein LOC106151431 n=1 Tax=Lingula anatina TaxID=7574 RepID=A0A1S3H2A4_LINAN|nr:uncharacterized protein LOC106151431 [Lingula anatina]XP_013380260.1 uncharacterized protein LOC106151431 [Lingula anatina]|eukprot:XP_013380179.1 uncharacterized protein LOC106151431 [Lingula anatina]